MGFKDDAAVFFTKRAQLLDVVLLTSFFVHYSLYSPIYIHVL